MPARPFFVPRPTLAPLDELAGQLESMRQGAVFSHRTAAHLWGLWTPAFNGLEVCSPAGARGSPYTTSVQRITVVAHRHRLPDHCVTTRFGLPVTTLEMTWLLLAPLLDIHDLIAAGDSALRLGASVDALADLVKRSARTCGVRRARQALGHLDARSRSRPESRIRAAIVLDGLPKPRVNEAVQDAHGEWLAEPDLHYEDAKLALEYNGADHAAFDRMCKDSVRLLDLQRAGWEVRTYTAAQAYRRLDQIVDDVRTLLSRRAPSLLTGRSELPNRVTRMRVRERRVYPSLGA